MMRLDKYLSERLGIPRGESRKLAAKGKGKICRQRLQHDIR